MLMPQLFPRARRDDMLIEDVLDEVLVYDLRSQQAHCLNPAAAAIWRACDGCRSVEMLAGAASEALGARCDGDVVRLALEQLRERNLLEACAPVAWRPLSRRELLGGVAVSAIVLPLITSLNAPTPAMAQSCPPVGPQGFQGVIGPQGACVCGPQGPQGPQGLIELSGDESGLGPQGFQGVVGPQGDCSGFQGPQGMPGPQGDMQELLDPCQGPQGVQGPQGPNSPQDCGS
jgi:hypothetical protein